MNSGKEKNIIVNYHPTETGIYYVMNAVYVMNEWMINSCDYHVSPFRLEGKLIVENPYGYLSGSEYGNYPFVIVMLIIYIVCLAVWILLCLQYSNEIMSVQVIILVVLVSYTFNYLFKFVYYYVLNSRGSDSFFVSLLSIGFDCLTRTLTRILTLMVCIG